MILFALCFFEQFFEPPSPMDNVKQLMMFGQYRQATEELTKMIQKQGGYSSELLIHRAKCYAELGMIKEASADCHTILHARGASQDDIRTAFSIRAQAHLIVGDLEAAEKDAKSANDRKTLEVAVRVKKLPKIAEAQFESGQYEEAKRTLDQILRSCHKSGKFLLMRAEIAWMEGDKVLYERLTKDLTDEFPNDGKLFYRRGVIALCSGKTEDAKKLLREATYMKKVPANAQEALKAANEIQNFYGKIEKYLDMKDVKNSEISLNRTLTAAQPICDESSELLSKVNVLKIRWLRLANQTDGLLDVLNEMIEKNPNNLELVLERGELQLDLGDYDAAIFDFNLVETQVSGNERAWRGLQKANEMKKKATHVDHYAILGIDSQASPSEVKSAYKKKVREWHPDQFGDPKKKKQAEQMMKNINTAYEVLNDPRKRRIYDNGGDPENPEQEGFHGGPGMGVFEDIFDFMGNPFGGGGQGFQFGGGQGFHFGDGQGVHFEFHF